MGKVAKQREDWWVIRKNTQHQSGETKQIGPLTHRGARSTALALHVAGWNVLLQRRDTQGKKVREILPQFLGIPMDPSVARAADKAVAARDAEASGTASKKKRSKKKSA